MKKILNLLLLATLVMTYTSCSDEVDDVFDKSSALRMQEALKSYNEVLKSPANGWRMDYYGATEYGGYTMFVKFNDDNTVTVANEMYGSGNRETSHYKLEQSAGVVLSFDEYNTLFHFFSDPANPAGVGTNGKGMEGDMEFRIITAQEDSVVMTGKKHGSRIIMTPYEGDWDSYLDEIALSEEEMAFGTYFYIVGTDTATVTGNYRELTFNYTDTAGVSQTLTAPYIVRPNSMHFYEPIELFGAIVTDFTYDSSAFTFTANDPTAILKGYVQPLSEALTSANWYICYANMSDGMKAYWDYAAPLLKTVEGETLGYAYYAGNTALYVKSGNYWMGFNMSPEILSDTQITYTLTGYAGSSAQQGNAQYYWSSKSDDGTYYFRYFIAPLAGTFNLTADNVRNPTIIILTDVDDPTHYYSVTKQAYPATQGM